MKDEQIINMISTVSLLFIMLALELDETGVLSKEKLAQRMTAFGNDVPNEQTKAVLLSMAEKLGSSMDDLKKQLKH